MLLRRTITALIGIPVLLGVAYIGGYVWDALVALLMTAAIYELWRMADVRSQLLFVSCWLGALFLVLRSLIGTTYDTPIAFGICLFFIIAVLIENEKLDGRQVAWMAMSTVYTGYLFGFAVAINHLAVERFFYLLLIFLLTWASDTGAYFFGRYCGKRKLCPHISPNKTWGGAIGGVLLTMLVATALLYGKLPLGNSLTLGFVASLMAQMGDMFESMLKRYCQVKDAGNVLPGHGGILDRFDSFLLVAPVVFILLAA